MSLVLLDLKVLSGSCKDAGELCFGIFGASEQRAWDSEVRRCAETWRVRA